MIELNQIYVIQDDKNQLMMDLPIFWVNWLIFS